MNRFWSESISGLTPYTPGEQPKIDNLIKLNTNENPYGPSPRVIDAIKAATDNSLRRYPDPNCSDLKRTIADYYLIQPEQVFVGNSSDEVLGHTFRALLKQSKDVLFPDLTYSFYPVYCSLFDIGFEKIALRNDFSLNIEDYNKPNGGIIFANPNAPTGLALNTQKIESLLKFNRDSVVVVDEAYADFSPHSAVSLINDYPNLLIVQTLSKSRSLAGLRVGFALGNANLIAALECVKNSFHPYALSRLSIAGAIAAIEDQPYFESTIDKVVSSRESSSAALASLGFEVLPSNANFLLARFPGRSAESLYTALRERGILIRYFNEPRITDYIRITIGNHDEMQMLADALADIIGAVP